MKFEEDFYNAFLETRKDIIKIIAIKILNELIEDLVNASEYARKKEAESYKPIHIVPKKEAKVLTSVEYLGFVLEKCFKDEEFRGYPVLEILKAFYKDYYPNEKALYFEPLIRSIAYLEGRSLDKKNSNASIKILPTKRYGVSYCIIELPSLLKDLFNELEDNLNSRNDIKFDFYQFEVLREGDGIQKIMPFGSQLFEVHSDGTEFGVEICCCYSIYDDSNISLPKKSDLLFKIPKYQRENFDADKYLEDILESSSNIETEKNKLFSLSDNSNIYKREGNKIYFGSYFINNEETKEPIEWDILEEKDGKALIISHYLLDAIMFDDESNNYEKSFIRKWLNDDFYNIAFDEKEKAIINVTLVDNGSSSVCDEHNDFLCNNTRDKIFLISYYEAIKYYKYDEEGTAYGTNYAKNKGLWIDSGCGSSYWFLRSPSDYDFDIPFRVDSGGDVVDGYGNVNETDAGIRPACWIKL